MPDYTQVLLWQIYEGEIKSKPTQRRHYNGNGKEAVVAVAVDEHRATNP